MPDLKLIKADCSSFADEKAETFLDHDAWQQAGIVTDLLVAEGPDEDEEEEEEPERGWDDQRDVPRVEALLRDVLYLEKNVAGVRKQPL